MPIRLRIGVNALYLIPGGVGGTEIYLRNLLQALAEIDRRNQYFVYVNRETGPDLCPRAASFIPVETGVRARFRPGRLIWEQAGLCRRSIADKIDVLFSPGFTSPLLCRGRKVTVIHDLQHKRQPGNFGFVERLAWNALVARSARDSDLLITVSESSKRDIEEVYKTPPAKTRVVRHGVEAAFAGLRENEDYPPTLPAEAGLPDCRYLLAVSTVHPHKNWERLLGAFRRLVEEGSELHLVICGLPGKRFEKLRKTLDGSELRDRVHLLGWQPRRILIGLYKFAEALVFPSTFEGFGMPVAEALTAGVPVVCSDIPPLREIADGCAGFFDPLEQEQIAAAMRQVLTDSETRKERVLAGLRRSAAFSWRRAAEQTLSVFLDAAVGRRP